MNRFICTLIVLVALCLAIAHVPPAKADGGVPSIGPCEPWQTSYLIDLFWWLRQPHPGIDGPQWLDDAIDWMVEGWDWWPQGAT